MTLLDELIEGASGDTAVTTLLRKVKVVAARAEVPALDEWVQHELDGYPEGATIPEYRGPFQVEALGTFSGPFGSGIQNAPIPSIGFPPEFRDGRLFYIQFAQPIAQIEELSRSGDNPRAQWPANAIALTNSLIESGKVALYEGMGLVQAWQPISRGQLVAIIDAVRTRILDLALAMERSNPATGQTGAPPLPPGDQHQIVTNIYGNANVAVASTGFTQSIDVGIGDRASLTQYLASLGLAESDINDLFAAIQRDGSEASELGPATSQWLGRIMLSARELGIEAAGGLIAVAVAKFLGIG